MRALLLALPFALLSNPAFADCGNDQQIFSCSIGKRVLEICFEQQGDVFSYTYGPQGRPELSLWQTTAELDFKPWPGIGSAIWENVTFYNNDYSYEVWTSVQRDPEDDSGLSGGVTVMQGDEIKASLTCDQDSASQSLDVIYEIKQSFGQCWNFETQAWSFTCD